MEIQMKTLFWVGTSRKDLAALPSEVKDVFDTPYTKPKLVRNNYKVAKAHSQDTSK